MFKKRTVIIGGISIAIITFFITFILSSSFFIFGGGPFVYQLFGENAKYGKINKVRALIDKYYVDDADENKMLEGAAKGVAEGVGDPYTSYFTAKEFSDFQTQMEGSYAGLGISVTVDPKDNLVTVIAPFEDTPGEKAGILSGDKIVKVDGKDVWGDKLDEAVGMMKGPKNTEVTLTIVREGESQPIDKTVKRDIIVLKTVKHKVIDQNIGYLRITMFDEKTSDEFNVALNDLYSKNIKGLVIDLRDNPGGALDQVVKIADRLVPEGIIVYTEDKEKNKKTEMSDKEEITIPLAILVNGGSASASEILSGAVKDHNKGILVGTKTFGKGLVQQIMPLGDGSALKVTIAKYFTPSGVCIQGIGIQPDINIDLPEDLKKKSIVQLDENEDIQLQKALEAIKK